MGLNGFMTQEGIVNQDPVKVEWKAVLLEIHKVTDDNQIPVFKWQNDYSNPSTIQSHLIIADLDEFVVIDPATGNATYPLLHNTDVPCIVKQTSTEKLYSTEWIRFITCRWIDNNKFV